MSGIHVRDEQDEVGRPSGRQRGPSFLGDEDATEQLVFGRGISRDLTGRGREIILLCHTSGAWIVSVASVSRAFFCRSSWVYA